MKNSMKLVLPLAALALGLAAPFTRADETPQPPAKAEHPGKGEEKKGPRGDRLQAILDKLDLTAEQKEKIKPIREESRKAMGALRDDKSLDREARRVKAQEVLKAHVAQVRAFLTPEQQSRLDEMKDEWGPARGPRKDKTD
jgi:Spy/CpxP family protein refolding chaperone